MTHLTVMCSCQRGHSLDVSDERVEWWRSILTRLLSYHPHTNTVHALGEIKWRTTSIGEAKA